MTYKEHLKELKKMIQRDFGKCCVDFDIDCCVCRVYLLLEILSDISELEPYG